MNMTTAQLATIKAAINGDPTAAAFENGDSGNQALATYLNTVPASPTMVWRPVVSAADMAAVIDWSAFAALTVAKQNTYFALQSGPVDATSVNIRNGFNTVFGAGATLTALTALAQRGASRFEAMFTTSNVCSVFGQSISAWEVGSARNS